MNAINVCRVYEMTTAVKSKCAEKRMETLLFLHLHHSLVQEAVVLPPTEADCERKALNLSTGSYH